MQIYSLDIIGTHLDIRIDTDGDISDVSQKIQKRLSDFELRFSRFIPDNWLHKLNKNRRWILDEDELKMLSYMLEVAHCSGGYFDPTIGKRLREMWYGNQDTQVSLESIWDYRDIEITGNEVILHSDIELEFWGVGKWYLIDVLRDMLDGYPRFLINFGGDMYGRGGWNIGLESPFAPDEVVGTLYLDDLYVACSAPTRRKWWNHHHLVDPHTGQSSSAVIASYIEWSSGMSTDAYATTLCVMPWEIAIATLKKTPEISGVIISHEWDLYKKEGGRSEIFE